MEPLCLLCQYSSLSKAKNLSKEKIFSSKKVNLLQEKAKAFEVNMFSCDNLEIVSYYMIDIG